MEIRIGLYPGHEHGHTRSFVNAWVDYDMKWHDLTVTITITILDTRETIHERYPNTRYSWVDTIHTYT